MSTYTILCLCGRSSPKLGSKEAMRNWHTEHKREECAARRSGRTGAGSFQPAPVRRARPVDAELAELVARARQLQPIPKSSEPAAAPREQVWAWVGDRNLAKLTRIDVPEPAARDRWGRPIKAGLFR